MSTQSTLPVTARTLTIASEPEQARRRRENPFGNGSHYVRVGQNRAREAALCDSELSADSRLLLLALAEVQSNGCCPMGPEVWEPALGLNQDAAAHAVAALIAVGFLTADSDLYCLHVHGLAADKGTGKKRLCGHQAKAKRRGALARPKRNGYQPLLRTGRRFCAPFTRLVA